MDWKKKTILYYGLVGLVSGIMAGILSVKNAEDKNKQVDFSPKDTARICMNALNSMQKLVFK